MQLREVSNFESQDFLLTVKGEKKRTFKNDVQVSGLDKGAFLSFSKREKHKMRSSLGEKMSSILTMLN